LDDFLEQTESLHILELLSQITGRSFASLVISN
jgi:hypothetical protein